MSEVSCGCSWYQYRFNVVPFGVKAAHTKSEFCDSLEHAREIKRRMLADGMTLVHIYDTVEGQFFD
jgi:hypothetical protein